MEKQMIKTKTGKIYDTYEVPLFEPKTRECYCKNIKHQADVLLFLQKTNVHYYVCEDHIDIMCEVYKELDPKVVR